MAAHYHCPFLWLDQVHRQTRMMAVERKVWMTSKTGSCMAMDQHMAARVPNPKYSKWDFPKHSGKWDVRWIDLFLPWEQRPTQFLKLEQDHPWLQWEEFKNHSLLCLIFEILQQQQSFLKRSKYLLVWTNVAYTFHMVEDNHDLQEGSNVMSLHCTKMESSSPKDYSVMIFCKICCYLITYLSF